MAYPAPKVPVGFAVEGIHESLEYRTEEGGPGGGLRAECFELVDAFEEIFPVGLFAFEGDKGNAAA